MPGTPPHPIGCGGVERARIPRIGKAEKQKPGRSRAFVVSGVEGGLYWWAVQGSNLRPLPCEGIFIRPRVSADVLYVIELY